MEYEFNGEHRFYTVANLKEFVHCQPIFFGTLSRPGDIKKMLQTYLINISLFAKAQQMQIEENEEYQLFRKRYQHNILLHHYKQENIYPNIFIHDEEIRDYYQEHQDDLKCFESASIIVYSFKDINDALEGRRQILSGIESQKKILHKNKKSDLAMRVENIDIEVKDSNLDKSYIDLISQLNIGQVSAPFKVEDEYQVILLSSKNGIITKPFNYAKDDIKQVLTSVTQREITFQQIKKFQTLYPIKVNRMKEYLKKNGTP